MSKFINITEQPGPYRHLEKMSARELLDAMNEEDHRVAPAVKKAIPMIEKLVMAVADSMLAGGRLFYIGAGTSGRLGILDASEIPPTYGLPDGQVVGLIAGGDNAIRYPVENAEDAEGQGWKDLLIHGVNKKDVVIGIASSGATPYVNGALKECRNQAITTGCIVCNPGSPMAANADYPVEVIVGPEFVTGSTRMKSGSAQKMTLNMISTSVMILIGRVEDNRMVNMQLTNSKLLDRGTQMVMERTGIADYETAKKLLQYHGSVWKAVESFVPDRDVRNF